MHCVLQLLREPVVRGVAGLCGASARPASGRHRAHVQPRQPRRAPGGVHRGSHLHAARRREDDHLGVGARRPDVADRRVCSARKRCAPRPGSGLADRQLHERALQRDAGQSAPDDHARPNPGPHELRHAVHRLGNDPARRSARRSARHLGRLEGDADHRRNRLLPAVPPGAVLAGPLDRQDAGARGGRRRSSSTHCWPTRPRSRSSRRGPDAPAVADQGRARLSLRLVGVRVRRLGDLHRARRVDEGPDRTATRLQASCSSRWRCRHCSRRSRDCWSTGCRGGR